MDTQTQPGLRLAGPEQLGRLAAVQTPVRLGKVMDGRSNQSTVLLLFFETLASL